MELWEKIGLIATAGLLSVLIPPLRNRLLGVGRPRDAWVAVAFGVGLGLWGSKMGVEWFGHHLNLRAIGIIFAGILGGIRAGATAGALTGAFFVTRVSPDTFPWALLASIFDGVAAGWVAGWRERYFGGWRAVRTTALIQTISLSFIAIGLAASSKLSMPSILLALGAQVVAVSAGVALIVNVARLVLAREEHAVALVQARASADALSLQQLRNRLEPHFLFNALNTLRATIRTNPDLARSLVSDLADLYRYLLHHPQDAQLIDEVEHASAYLAIEKARLGGRLSIEKSIPENVRDAPVPALLLQPIVENAVKHGIATKPGAGLITIRALNEGPTLRIEVQDSCAGEAGAPSQAGAGVALCTLRERLEKRYGLGASLELRPQKDGMLVVIQLPKVEPQQEEAA